MDRTVLFSYLRRAPFGGKLTSSQVAGVELLLHTWESEYPGADIRWVANNLAQIFHETGGRMVPVRETFADSDSQAVARLEKAFASGRLPWVSKPYWNDGFFGRGHIQITHRVNYRRLGLRLGLDLAGKPSLALDPKTSARIAIVGMVEGLFTGKKLRDFFNDTTDDPVNARRIVNGLDKASLIAQYHRNFLDALVKAQTHEAHEVPDAWDTDATPDDATPTPSEAPGFWTGIGAAITGLIGAVTQVKDPYALAAVGLILVAVGVFAWLYFKGRISFRRT